MKLTKNKIVFITCFLLICQLSLNGQIIDTSSLLLQEDNFIYSDELKNASVGFEFIDLKTEKILLSHQANKSYIPASTLKIITTSTALELFGKQHRFKTFLQHDGYIVDTTLYGNIYIKGGGDPTLSSTYFEKEADILDSVAIQIKSLLGISTIEGDIIGDATLIPYSINRKWVWEDIANYYGSSPNALSFHDNVYYIYFKSGEAESKTDILKIEPSFLPLQFTNEVYASAKNKDNAYIFGDINCPSRIITGTIPQRMKRFRIKGSIPDPAFVVAQKLKQVLQKHSINVKGNAKSLYVKTHFNRTDIFYQQSAPLKDIVKVTNEESVNIYAELLLRQIGLQIGNDATLDSCIVSLKEFWENKGICTEGIYMYDGSGLSHFNAIPLSFFSSLLLYMYKESTHKEVFLNSLAIAGQEGTLQWFGVNPPLYGNLIAKSGSLTKVIGYTGYFKTHQNKMIAFTIMINNYKGTYSNMKYQISLFLDKIYHTF